MCPSEIGFDEIGFDEIVCQRGKQHCIECTRRWLEAEREVDEVRNTSEQLKVGDSK